MDLGPRLRTSGGASGDLPGRRRLIYGVPIWRRLVFGVFGVALIGLMIYDGAVSVFPLILVAGSLVGAFYLDEWVFDLSHREMEHRSGVYPMMRRETLSFGAVGQLKIEKIGLKRPADRASTDATSRGGLGMRVRDRRFYKLSVELRDGRTRVLNIDRSRRDQMTRDAERIAAFVGVNLTQTET